MANTTGTSRFYTDGSTTASGTWQSYDWRYQNSANESWQLMAQRLQSNQQMSYIPQELADEGFEPIQGTPKGAKYLVSYMFKQPKDPVVFLKNEKDMKELVKKLLANKAVDHQSIIIHKISAQYKPKQVSFLKKIVTKVKDIKLNKI
jgi:hypothetical protein